MLQDCRIRQPVSPLVISGGVSVGAKRPSLFVFAQRQFDEDAALNWSVLSVSGIGNTLWDQSDLPLVLLLYFVRRCKFCL